MNINHWTPTSLKDVNLDHTKCKNFVPLIYLILMYQNQMNEIFVVVFRFLYLELRRLNIRSVLSTNIVYYSFTSFWVIFLDFSFEENELLCGNKISFRTVFCPSINNSVQFLSHKFVHVWKTSSSLCTYLSSTNRIDSNPWTAQLPRVM